MKEKLNTLIFYSLSKKKKERKKKVSSAQLDRKLKKNGLNNCFKKQFI
jgi:hypothetical protein